MAEQPIELIVADLLQENIILRNRIGALEDIVYRIWHLYAIGMPAVAGGMVKPEWTPADGLAARPRK